MTSHGNFIDGAWTPATHGVPNINPSDLDDVIGEFAAAQPAEVDAAIGAARRAFPAWSASGPLKREAILRRTAAELRSRQEELGTLLAREEGKTSAEGILEAARAASIFDFFAGECLRLAGETLPSQRSGVEIAIEREPLGVVAIRTPWDFPLAIPAWKIAPALCYGNTVIFKPAELVPACAVALVDILARAGLPDGVLNLIMGSGQVVGQSILDDPRLDAVSFTGSTEIGRKIAVTCAQQLRRVQLEMGGKNPLIVLDDADLDHAVELALNGAFFSTGQRCTASSRLIVTDGIHDQFVDALKSRMAKLVVGHALAPTTEIGPVASAAQLARNGDYIDLGTREGALLAFGGRRLECETKGYFFEPALFTHVSNDMRIAREEIFGPIAAVIRAKDYDDALMLSNDTAFGLAAGICTRSLKHAAHFRRHANAGMVMVNLPTAATEYHAPFGGKRASRLGPREQGPSAAEFYTSLKTSYCFADI